MILLKGGKKYNKLWAKVDSLERKGLTRSALKVVDKIYAKAKEANNSENLVKSLIYRVKYLNVVEEMGFEKMVANFEKEATTLEAPASSILHIYIAGLYWQYYQRNMWTINQRTTTANFDNKDIQTWGTKQFVEKATAEYNLALKDAEVLQKIPFDTYEELLVGGKKTAHLRPTLYDFLAVEALKFFMDTRISLNRPANKFELKEDFYFADIEEFISKNIHTRDSISLHFRAVEVFQKWLAFRAGDSNTAAMLDAELKRIDFVYANSVNPVKASLYLSFLQRIEKKYADNPISAQASYRIADYYRKKSSSYKPHLKILSGEEAPTKWNLKTAVEICNRVIKKFPKSFGAEQCRVVLNTIKHKSLNFNAKNIELPKQAIPLHIEYQNVKTAYVRVASISQSALQKLSERYYGNTLVSKLLSKSKIVKSTHFELPDDGDFHKHSLDYLLEPLNLGTYVIFLSNNKNFSYKKNTVSYKTLQVSKISYINRQLDNGDLDVIVQNRQSGAAMKDVKIVARYQKYNYKKKRNIWFTWGTYRTDAQGKVLIKAKENSKSLTLDFSFENDFLSSGSTFYLRRYNKEVARKDIKVTIFTDRAIYRPGQTIFYKGICLENEDDKHQIVSNFPIEVKLYDANYQEVAKIELTTNSYGTFTGSFVVPLGRITGNYRISTFYDDKYIKVEEYKRPKFEVNMLPFDGNYLLNDTVRVKAEAVALSGAKITDADVSYRIVRTPVWYGWWYWNIDFSETVMAVETTKTDHLGQFEVKFKALPDLALGANKDLAFNYKIVADVTDINGETRSVTSNLTVGSRALNLNTALADKIDISTTDTLKIGIETLNLNGNFIPATGQIKISKLKSYPEPLRKRTWEMPDVYLYSQKEWNTKYSGNVYQTENKIEYLPIEKEIFSQSFDTKEVKKLLIGNFKTWKTGQYLLEMNSKDVFGNPVKKKVFFEVFASQSATVPYATTTWFKAMKTTCEPNEKAQFLIGSSLKDLQVLYEVLHKNKVVAREIISVSNNQKLIEVPVKEEYRGGFSVQFSFVKNDRFYAWNEFVSVPYSNKELKISFETFRSKLYPGQKEEWRLKITGSKGEKFAAEMLATLYDASLDQFAANYWGLSIFSYDNSSIFYRSGTFDFGTASSWQKDFNTSYYISSPSYASLNWFGFYYGYNIRIRGLAGSVSAVKMGRKFAKKTAQYAFSAEEEEGEKEMVDEVMVNDNFEPPSPVVERDESDKDAPVPPSEEVDLSEVKTRTNFNETAFFYPDLQTNEKGEIIVQFTIPESLTRWKMLGFAHTKNLEYGFVQNTLVTQKDLMVVPNVPRFFRENDRMKFPVKISNLSEGKLNGVVQLEFFDAISMQPVHVFTKSESKQKKFEVAAGLNTLVNWELKIPVGVGALVYKVVAKAGDFSDGEEQAVPVLTNSMLVTESMPLPIRGGESKVFKFKKLLKSSKSSTLRHHKLTLEFTSNPAWYAVQALPYLMEYPYECAEQTFSRFYANSLASHIVNSSPKVKRVFDSWASAKNSTALLSNLEKNQELKALMLEETPWVLNAQNETERKKRVALLFDLNKMSRELDKALEKLLKSQKYNGGWAWFDGMPESRYITQHIVTGMGQLDHLGVKNVRQNTKVWKMLKKAVGFLDEKIVKDYDYLKRHYNAKEMKANHLSSIALHYLYARSFFKDVPLQKKTRKAFDYYKNQAATYWLSRSLYEKGMSALMLHRFENQVVAKDIVKSLKENSLHSDELGMYWKENVAGYYWYQAPIETQAMMVQVFDEVADDEKSVDDLKVWLLKQKQTQDWKTTKATVEAVYALLLRGDNWLTNDELVKIKLGDLDIDPKKMPDVQVEAGTGYFKTSWSGDEVKPKMGKVSVSKVGKGIAWGAVYWQYFEQLDKITTHETPLKLKKQLFVQRETENGAVIEPITAETELKIGDLVKVRIELRVDRDMEYVHMKDMRAAAFEPVNVISRYKYQAGLGYYESTRDAATNFFISYLRKGTYVFEYPLRVNFDGDFSNGITTIQCMYAPEFTSHSEGIRVQVK